MRHLWLAPQPSSATTPLLQATAKHSNTMTRTSRHFHFRTENNDDVPITQTSPATLGISHSLVMIHRISLPELPMSQVMEFQFHSAGYVYRNPAES